MQSQTLFLGLDEFRHQDPYVQMSDFEDENNHSNEFQDDVTNKSTTSLETKEEEEEHYEQDETSVLIPTEYWRNILREHPWSISDPGPPKLVVESCHRGYYSSPIVKGGLNEEQGHHQGTFAMLVLDGLTRVMSKALRNKVFLKWVFIVLNVIIELCQVTLTQEAAKGKIGHNFYLNLSIVASSICLIMTLLEACHEGKRGKVAWQKRGYCCWFYYPGVQGRIFGKVSIYFGLISSTIQLSLNLIMKLTKKRVKSFDYAPLLLSVCYLVAMIVASQEKSSLAIVKCKTHGYNAVEGTQMMEGGSGTWVFECPECQMEIST